MGKLERHSLEMNRGVVEEGGLCTELVDFWGKRFPEV